MTQSGFSTFLFSSISDAGSVKRQAPVINSVSTSSTVSTTSSSSSISRTTTPATTTTTTTSTTTPTTSSISITTSSVTTTTTSVTSTTQDTSGEVVDPRTPAGTAVFIYPVVSAKNYTVQKSGTNMSIVWEFKNVVLLPKLLTLQIKILDPSPAYDQNAIQPGIPNSWATIASNFSFTDHYDWFVNVPEGDGYMLRLFDSNLGPTGVQAGRLQASTSNKFVVYRSNGVSLGPNPFSSSSLNKPEVVAWVTVVFSFFIVLGMLWN
ncbi:hypothetical protein HMI56_001607 [Coelomomyces lativittatus]|nr:hypothetical protein HMI56_001607 [Coelomomyces lativittatus]